MPHPLASHVRRMWTGIALGTVLLGAAALAGEQFQEQRQLQAKAAAMTSGDPEDGRLLIQSHGCGGCHQIPGVLQARGKVGPPLSGIASRAYIAGRLRNTPDHLMLWVENAKAVAPRPAMPEGGVDASEARDIAAYLYTLP